MDVEEFKDDVRSGRISIDRVIDLVVTLQWKLEEATRRIEELERKLAGRPTEKVADPFSVRAEDKKGTQLFECLFETWPEPRATIEYACGGAGATHRFVDRRRGGG